ncbi:retrotransposon protein, putative, ty1-copia subclass [Tanacetum coccineum]|uniref:Retrotransposon protein, putative, ty1-copia subclass n=1 Tax=Tanacetum coccineum TaxID=301880 RepID=A0ABQ4YX26_9ASTR
MDTSKRGTIPMQPNVDFSKSQGPSTLAEVKQMKGIPYASAIGSIMYAVRCTGPDVAFSQNLTSGYQQNPGESHWTAVKNILKYIRNTKDMFLVYGGDSTTGLSVTCYTDASWKTDRDDLRSQTGYVLVMNGGAVDWKNSKQSTTAMSFMKAEYIVTAEATMEAIWIRKFIFGLGVVPSIDKPMDMYCDNTCPITIADEPGVQKVGAVGGLRGSKKLKPRALNLYVGDGHHAAIEAIGSFHLCLPSGLILVLHNCHYAPSITRGIIYCRSKGWYFKIDLFNSNTNDSSMYAVSNKRAKINLDSTLLWHYRLGHISKKRIEKLQHDGLLISTDNQSFDKCVSCMSRNMARKPYSHQMERAKDLLGLIHTDEVENQLGKTIKSLHFYRGGEYMSQEFLDHLKEHRIIAHRTPPYTPQHNGVSERRNRTLLDMVRSMLSQTTLPKSFWDYARESAARILNMVQIKMVEKTPYEVLVSRNAEFFENSLINQEASRSLEDLEIIQEEDTHPSETTSLHHDEDDQEIDEP